MNNNSELERDPAVETDYSAEEAEQMGAFQHAHGDAKGRNAPSYGNHSRYSPGFMLKPVVAMAAS